MVRGIARLYEASRKKVCVAVCSGALGRFLQAYNARRHSASPIIVWRVRDSSQVHGVRDK